MKKKYFMFALSPVMTKISEGFNSLHQAEKEMPEYLSDRLVGEVIYIIPGFEKTTQVKSSDDEAIDIPDTITIDRFIKETNPPVRVQEALLSMQSRRGYKLRDVNKEEFLKMRNTGLKSWTIFRHSLKEFIDKIE